LSSDPKRAEPKTEADRRPDETQRVRSETEGAERDDLEALATSSGLAASSSAALAPELDEDPDLGALANITGRHAVASEDDDSLLDLGRLIASARHSLPPAGETSAPTEPPSLIGSPLPGAQTPSLVVAPPPRTPWLVPLMLGLGLGLGIGAGLYGMSLRHAGDAAGADAPTPASRSPEPASPAPAPTALAANANVVAAVDPPAVNAKPAAPSPAHPPERTLASTASASHAGVRAMPSLHPDLAAAAPAPAAPAPAAPASPTPPVLAVHAAAEEQAPAPEVAEDTASGVPAAAAASRSMDTLLDEALSPSARKAALEHQRELDKQHEQLPPAPSRDEVTQAMTVLLPAIHGCAMGHSGLATAVIVVRGDGHVAGVDVTGSPFAGTASGRCMEGVIRRAHFPRFKQPAFRIRFPLAIQ
jgi:hypothetical protein